MHGRSHRNTTTGTDFHTDAHGDAYPDGHPYAIADADTPAAHAVRGLRAGLAVDRLRRGFCRDGQRDAAA